MLLKNPMRYNEVGRDGSAIKLKDFLPHQVFLVKKAKDVKKSKNDIKCTMITLYESILGSTKGRERIKLLEKKKIKLD